MFHNEGIAPPLPALPSDPTFDVIGTVNIPFDGLWCPVCSRQIVPKHVLVSIQPCPSTPPLILPPAVTTKSKRSRRQDISTRPTDSKIVGPIHPSSAKSNKAIKGSPSTDTPPGATSGAIIPNSKPALPVRHRMVIDPTPPPLYCSDVCRLADLLSCPINTNYNAEQCTSNCLPPIPPAFSSTHGSRDNSDDSSGASYDSPSSITASPTTQASPPSSDGSADAYLHLSAIYSFAPLPPRPRFTPKAATPAKEPTSSLKGGIILAARRIKAALGIKTTKSFMGITIPNDPADDNEPIPGWTDSSNAWRASVYGFAPPRDFTRTDPDDAAIRAYGSYIASPHRSHGVHSTLGEGGPIDEIKNSVLLSSLLLNAVNTPTEKLYHQYSTSFTQRAQSRRTSTRCSLPTSTHTGLTREVPLLKPGAEGRLLVPNVKMRRANCSVADMVRSSMADQKRSCVSQWYHDANTGAVETTGDNSDLNATCGSVCSRPTIGPTTHVQSYSSEAFTYPIMRIAPKKEKRIERRLVDGVECNVEVEVLIEEPIKRLFLFRGACD